MTDSDALIFAVEDEDDEEPTAPLNLNGATITADGQVEDRTDATDSDGDGRSLAEIVVDAPNGTPPTAHLDDEDAIEISVPLGAGERIEVYRWGAYMVSDASVPSGLTVRLLDGDDTVIEEDETARDTNTSDPLAEYENDSSGTEIAKLQAFNDTGDALDDEDDGVGAAFGYVVV